MLNLLKLINLKYPRDFFHKAYLHPPKLSRVESTQVESVELSTICQKVGAVLVDIVLISSLRILLESNYCHGNVMKGCHN